MIPTVISAFKSKKTKKDRLYTRCGTPLVYAGKLQLRSEVLDEIDAKLSDMHPPVK
jgi:hypothetical protein